MTITIGTSDEGARQEIRALAHKMRARTVTITGHDVEAVFDGDGEGMVRALLFEDRAMNVITARRFRRVDA